jgi:probable HAF family extracellular repeat protein
VGWTLVGDPPEARAFLWTEETGMRDLGTLGGNYTVALSINLAGQAAGICRKASGQERACLWTIQPIRARFPFVPIGARS